MHRSVARLVEYTNPHPGQVTLRRLLFFFERGRNSGGSAAKPSLTQGHCAGRPSEFFDCVIESDFMRYQMLLSLVTYLGTASLALPA